MFLLYVDESGNPDGNQDRYFVFGGLAVFERKGYWLASEADALEKEIFGSNAGVEFHAQQITAHKVEPWHSLPSDKRTKVLEGLCTIINDPQVVLFSVAVEITQYRDPVERAFEEICNRFDLFLKRLHAQGNTQRGLIIFDESRYEQRFQQLLPRYQSLGTRFGRVSNFADVPLFADSRATRLLQLADLVAYAVYRRYDRSHAWLFDRIVARFDSENDVLHGLVHMARDTRNCACPACLTRRLAGH